MSGIRLAAAASLSGMAPPALPGAPALAQSEPVKRLNWLRSIFAGFVLAGIGIAIVAWFFALTRASPAARGGGRAT
jgi:drug/metabolite transporter (DMT)-like permease